MRRPGSEDPHLRQRNFKKGYCGENLSSVHRLVSCVWTRIPNMSHARYSHSFFPEEWLAVSELEGVDIRKVLIFFIFPQKPGGKEHLLLLITIMARLLSMTLSSMCCTWMGRW